jgi:hypothetical protein
MVRSRIVSGIGSTLCAVAFATGTLVSGSAQADAPATRALPFLPTHFPGDLPTPLAGGGGSPKLVNMGGPVIENIQAVAVFWGAASSTAQTFAKGFLPAAVNSAYIDQLSEYNTSTQKIARGTYLSAVSITPTTATGNSIDDTQIGPELAGQITSGVLPKPTYGKAGFSNTLYVVFFAPGISITQGGHGSCVSGGFCGYHSDGSYNGKPFPYAVIPDMGAGSGCDQGCGSGAEADCLGGTTSHEMSEAITDMDVGDNNVAWYDNTNGEIGDICAAPLAGATNSGMTGTLVGYTFQYEWSNMNNKCELTNPSIGPQGGGGCTSNTGCSAPTPVCITSSGTCVQCAANTDCSGATPICDTTAHTCRACTADADCSAPTPVCATGTSDPNAGKCVQCTTNSQCTTTAPICKSDACGGCTSNADCTDPTNNTCNTGTGACGPAPASSGSSSGGNNGGSSGGNNGGSSGGNNGGSSGGNNGGSSGGNNGGDGGSGNNNNGGSGAFADNGSSSAGCGCAEAGAPATSGLGVVGVLFGLAVAVGRGKRTRKNRA